MSVPKRLRHRYSPPLSRAKLARLAQRRREAELQSAFDASRVTEADLAAMIFDLRRDSADQPQDNGDRDQDSRD